MPTKPTMAGREATPSPSKGSSVGSPQTIWFSIVSPCPKCGMPRCYPIRGRCSFCIVLEMHHEPTWLASEGRLLLRPSYGNRAYLA